MDYTDRIDGFQIRDVCYFGKPPRDSPPMYDIVKWVQTEPYEAIDVRTGKRKNVVEYCYSVAALEWERKESGFDFKSIGLRWLESKPTERIIEAILDFAEKKTQEILKEEKENYYG